jgi:hypothetical protein
MDGTRIKLPRSKTEAQAASTAKRVLERGCREVAKTFNDPDDDWDPIWLIVGESFGVFLAAGNIHKHAMTEAVGDYARRSSGIAVGHVNSSWMVLVEHLAPARSAEIVRQMEATGSTEGIAERVEIVLLAIHTASRSEMWTAKIERHEDAPPSLGRFTRPPVSGGGEMSGAMVDPLRAGLVRLG